MLVNMRKSSVAVCYLVVALITGNNPSSATPSEDFVIFENKFDVVITQAPDQSISGHRAVLAASIPYISAISTEDTSEIMQIELSPDLDLSAIGSLFEFAYTQQIRIDRKNVEGLLTAAQFLRMNNIVDACSMFLVTRFNAETAVSILNTADIIQLPVLASTANAYLRRNFHQMSQSPQILELCADAFLDLLRSNDLNVSAEEPVFEVAVRWINHKPNDRSALQWMVLQNIRFPLLPLEYLATRVSNELLVRNSVDIRKLVDEAIHEHVLPEHQQVREGCRKWPRNGSAHFFIMDYENRHLQIVDPDEKRVRHATLTSTRTNFGAAVLDCQIFLVGGQHGDDYLNTVETYNPMADTWKPAPPMNAVRRLAVATTVNNRIYVSGGESKEGHLNSAESFNANTNSWSTLAPMLEARLGHQLVGFGAYVWAVGGRRAWEVPVNTVERFDMLRNRWTWEKPMLVERQALGVAALNGKLYACGGYQLIESGTLDSAEVFDPVQGTWKMIAPMTVPRKWFSLLAHKGRLYAVGGSNANGHLNGVDIYDPAADAWQLASDLDYAAEALTVMLNI